LRASRLRAPASFAPRGRGPSFDGPGDWRWLCLDHVRAFNAGYNYFEGMSPDEIEEAQGPYGGWDRETRAFAGRRLAAAALGRFRRSARRDRRPLPPRSAEGRRGTAAARQDGEGARAVRASTATWKCPGVQRGRRARPRPRPAYVFDPDTTLAICAGFARKNRRVMVQGYHGTGKSTHIEQVAARLNWPMIRINLDAHISRIDLVGRDAIVLRDGQQVTEFREGPAAVGAAASGRAGVRRI
jgi:hypothetical protein